MNKKLEKMRAACYMEQLPTELKLEIMGYLPGKDLARLACVSCEWRQLTPSSNSEVWKNLCHAEKGLMLSRNYMLRNQRKYDNNLGWNWKDMFGLWTLGGLKYFFWLLVYDCAEQGLHYAMKLVKEASKLSPMEFIQPNYDIYPSLGFMDQDPELPFFQLEWGSSRRSYLLQQQEHNYLFLHAMPPLEGQSYQLFPALPPPTPGSHQAGPLYQLNTDQKSVRVDEAPPGMQQQE